MFSSWSKKKGYVLFWYNVLHIDHRDKSRGLTLILKCVNSSCQCRSVFCWKFEWTNYRWNSFHTADNYWHKFTSGRSTETFGQTSYDESLSSTLHNNCVLCMCVLSVFFCGCFFFCVLFNRLVPYVFNKSLNWKMFQASKLF